MIERLPDFLRAYFEFTDPMNRAIIGLITNKTIIEIICWMLKINLMILITSHIVLDQWKRVYKGTLAKDKKAYKEKMISEDKYKNIRAALRKDMKSGFIIIICFYVFSVITSYMGILYYVYGVI